uniref:Uncharacterized protein n=1 Tax=Globisporangium ultimum (strain ATCC 200006 / CBS 805.95 / DAOM BR144) TaxID=431595 RepID=K3WTE6_GLOUD
SFVYHIISSTFLIVIAFPTLVVAHSFSTFTYDRAQYALNLQVFPRGEFETLARAIADPVQVTVVLKSLNSLRIRSALDFFTRVGTHVALIYRLHCLVGILRASRGHTFHSAYPHRHRVGVLFIVFPILLALFVYFSISTAKQECSYYPECAVYALRWTRIREDDRTQCPCIALIDGNIAMSTFAEWIAPRNVTEKVSQLATTGHLEIAQLLNRQLIAFPDELRHCTNLQQLQIEGKPTLPGLLSLPDDMFKSMHSLSFMHLATHSFRQLPSFHGLVNLRALTLAVLLALESLPDFDSLKKLERLVMIFLPSVDSIPDMSAIEDLQPSAILYRGTMCCNGFLDNNCNLTNSMC